MSTTAKKAPPPVVPPSINKNSTPNIGYSRPIAPTRNTIKKKEVLLFIPNLIGMTRVVFALLSIACMGFQFHLSAMIFYFLSSILDALDGVAARHFNQCSQFGAVLDMVTDRSSTSMLLCALCRLYSALAMPIFQVILALDLISHYARMVRYDTKINSFSSTKSGSSSHKNVKNSSPFLLKAYYTQRPVLFFVCMMNELFLASLYVFATFEMGMLIKLLVLGASFPVFFFKQVVHVIQLVESAEDLLELDLTSINKN